ncbi:ankyrin repeat-containing domain protein [Massariosphaeria phaeospora]|uniref:Ankyrin repeat-containing domain protein n=1 Tax=Massariosphaeria phaeospora TaxID=100035 RepID=A0A7C8M9I1_9PLEO|nr:ankyrin repeat-containing domain protein [Massariosphaeria phaeospora]
MPFVRPYLEQRLREGRTRGFLMLTLIRKVAERLTAENEDENQAKDYTSCVLELMTRAGFDNHVRELLFHGLEPFVRDCFESDLLAAAIYTNQMPLVKSLIDSQRIRPRRNNLGIPITIAGLVRRFEILDLFIARRNGHRLRDLYDVLKIATGNGDVEMVRYILSSNRNPFAHDLWSIEGFQPDRYIKDYRPGYAKIALRTPSVEVFNLMLAERAKWNLRPFRETFWFDLLHHVVREGWRTMTEHLISLGTPIEVPSQWQWMDSPLHGACEKGHSDVVAILLNHGAKIRGKDLEAAASHGHTATLTVLLERGADVHCEGAAESLFVAAKKGFIEIVRTLLDAGMDANQKSPSPMIGAVESEHEGIFWLLIERGARLDDAEVIAEAAGRAEAAGLDSMLSLVKRTMTGALPSERL